MKILVFDTETTGLPKKYNAPTLNEEDWPYIVQLSYILYDTSNNIVFTYLNEMIKIPPEVEVTEESINIHKITKEVTQTHGIDIKDALKQFNRALIQSDVAIAHNIDFDKKMIMAECIRNNIETTFSLNPFATPSTHEYCTMKNSVNLCKILTYNKYNKQYYKYPKLIELYKYLFNCTPEGLHNSMVDILLCLRCYGKIVQNVDFYELSENIKVLYSRYNLQ